MSKLTKETDILTQLNAEVIEALRRIRLDTHLTSDDMRAAIDEVLAMVSLIFYPRSKLNVPDTKSNINKRERRSPFHVQASVNRRRRRGRRKQ
jgi:hypothetical protein